MEWRTDEDSASDPRGGRKLKLAGARTDRSRRGGPGLYCVVWMEPRFLIVFCIRECFVEGQRSESVNR